MSDIHAEVRALVARNAERRAIFRRALWWALAGLVAIIGVFVTEANNNDWSAPFWLATGLCWARSHYWRGRFDALQPEGTPNA